MNRRERTGEFRRSTAQVNCNATTANTKYFVKGSGPQSLITSGCALMIACLRVLCGSSVYDQKNWSPSKRADFSFGRSSSEETCTVVVTAVEGMAYTKRMWAVSIDRIHIKGKIHNERCRTILRWFSFRSAFPRRVHFAKTQI